MIVVVRDDGVTKFIDGFEVDAVDVDIGCRIYVAQIPQGCVPQTFDENNRQLKTSCGIFDCTPSEVVDLRQNFRSRIFIAIQQQLNLIFTASTEVAIVDVDNNRTVATFVTASQNAVAFNRPGRYKLTCLNRPCVPFHIIVKDDAVIIS